MNDKKLPTLFVPSVVRRPLGFKPLEGTPQSFHELPSRVPMGDLQPETFRKTAEGFEVFYRSGDYSMKLNLEGDSFSADERYKGTELLYYMGDARMFLGPRMAQLRLGPTQEADQRIGSDLAEIGNIKYSPFGDVLKTGSFNSFPDGFLMSIIIPLAIDESVFQRLSRFFRDLPDDDSLSISGFMEFARHVVNYRQGLCSDVPDDPMLLYLWSLERGYLPAAMPVLEGEPDNRALTLRRMGYNLVLNVFMRDIFRVVRLLKEAGLIGEVQSANQEEATIIGNAYSLLGARDLSFYTDDLSRRVFYPAVMSEETDLMTPPLGHDEFERRLKTVLARYQSAVRDIRSEFDRKVSEVVSHG